ncbi:MAG: HNH endonuclease [Candidatus Omnitrophica bacterium]|nr:HNH endonuclease [Candidatus Omnitrophota bacterium]
MKEKCIYCSKDKAEEEFSKREHVIPQCFGKFTPGNLLLYKSVCDECNQFFGNNIELYLGRDTIEGVVRYIHGIKPRENPKKHKRLKFKIPCGELKGMIVIPRYSGVQGENDIDPVLQAGFFNKQTQEYDYFEPNDIPHAKELTSKGYEIKDKKIPLIAKDDNEMQSLLRVFSDKGMNIKPEEDLEWPEEVKKRNQTLVEGIIKIDSVVYRGICKIAFNYLACIVGKKFALREEFDGIRKFIRFGEGDSKEYFGVNEPPILDIDRKLQSQNIKVTNGHLIILGWKGTSLISRVSIFNLKTYLVKFCNNFNGVLIPIKSGHHFDVDSKEVSKLIAVNRRLLP